MAPTVTFVASAFTSRFHQRLPARHSHHPSHPSPRPLRLRRALPPALSAAAPRPCPPPCSQPAPPSTVPLSLGPIRFHVSGRHLLCLVPLLCASFIACAKLLYLLPRALSPPVFNAARLAVSTLFFLPTLLTELRAARPVASEPRRDAPRFLRAGFELGAIMFVANVAQIAGLRYTDASRAAFLNQLSTVLVPLVAAACGSEVLTARVGIGAACALGGVALLTLAGGSTAAAGAGAAAAALPAVGDALELVAALFVTLYVLRVSHHAKRMGGKSGGLVAVKVATQAALSFAWLGGGALMKRIGGGAAVAAVAAPVAAVPWTPLMVAANLMLVLWSGAMVSAAASWMQTKGQEAVPASEAAVLYAAQPLWASVIATATLGESMGMSGMLGAGLIVGGTVVSSTGEEK